MVSARYNEVIHKQTGECVSIFKFKNDATWIGRDKDKLIAKQNYCEFGKEVRMIMVDDYEKSNGKQVNAYFRKKQGETGILNNNMSGESNSHRIAKENVRDRLCIGDITINGENLKLNEIKDIIIEYRTSKLGYVIPDVIVLFKNLHPKYGLGIFFEIQFSKQSDKETIRRTYSRVIEGFSGVWLNKKNFDNDFKFIGDNVDVKSHKSLLIELEKSEENSFIKRINDYGRAVDSKIIEFEEKINSYCSNKIKDYDERSIFLKSQVDNAIDVCNDNISVINKYTGEVLDKKINPIVRRVTQEISEMQIKLNDSYKRWSHLNIDDIDKNIKDRLFKVYEKQLEKFYNEISSISKNTKTDLEKCKEQIINEIKNIDVKKLIILKRCPRCNKEMKIGKAMGGYNWYCEDFPYCDSIIKGGKICE